ncbi:hypothetical protein OBBRIDRAFT_783868 [Obba rivulosa]|uniref:Uncharacterized protein n=1 Tax=Obba rivulosa TaxID=1052685 RepID=A0A8E2AMI8_9APHY|nr:hypothetical protein OBBRIDRAFT_783868 [Obba rivulosa]
MQRTVDLPVGPHPGWELEEAEQDPEVQLHSVPDSLVLLQSLRQSRNKWLSSAFPKFSAKARGGRPAEVVPPPHTIKAHGRFDVIIGPHTLANTAFYEVHYIPQSPAGSAAGTPAPIQGASAMPHVPSSSNAAPQASTSVGAQSTASQVLSSLGVDTFVTPSLIAQVNAASLSNPTMSRLLQRAASGLASADELKTLGLLIQSLSTLQKADINTAAQIASAASQATAAPAPPPREFDLVIEFQERPSDKWIFPRGLVVCEREGSEDPRWRTSNVLISTSLPFPSTAVGSNPSDVPPEVVTFKLLRVSPTLWDTLLAWSGGELKMKENSKRLKEIMQKTSRAYLQYQLPDGPILSQLQTAVTQHATKPIMPANADKVRSKRKAPQRKTTVTTTDAAAASGETPQKRRQTAKSKSATHPPRIACHLCDRTDVPLMMGGRYCRECIDSGKAVAAVPQVPSRLAGEPTATAGGLKPSPSHAAQPSTETSTRPLTHPLPAHSSPHVSTHPAFIPYPPVPPPEGPPGR